MASLHVMGQLNQDSTHADDGGSRPYTRLAQKSKVDVHNIPGPAHVGSAYQHQATPKCWDLCPFRASEDRCRNTAASDAIGDIADQLTG